MYSVSHWLRIATYIICLTFTQAFVFNTLLDLLFADTLWLPVFLFSAIIAVISGYVYYVSTSVSNSLINQLYRYTGLWWGLLFNVFVGSIVYWFLILFAIPPLVASIPIGVSIILFILGLSWAKQIKLKELEIEIDNLPEFWHNKKVAFISDLHLGKTLGKDFLTYILNVIDQQNTELTLIGGDLFDSAHADWDSILEPFKSFRQNNQVLYVTGNHEYHIDYETNLRPHLENLNFQLQYWLFLLE
mgnify:CR=1 FL=1